MGILPRSKRRGILSIKVFAALQGETIREYMLQSVRARLKKDQEGIQVSALTHSLDHDPVLRELWNNEKDSAYDQLSKG